MIGVMLILSSSIFSSSEFIVTAMCEIFLDRKLDRVNLPDNINIKDFDVLNVSDISFLLGEDSIRILELNRGHVSSRYFVKSSMCVSKIVLFNAYSYGVLFSGFIALATNATSHVSYISVMSHFESGKFPEFTSIKPIKPI